MEKKRMEKKKRRLTGSTAAKIAAFFLLAITFVTGVIGIYASVWLFEGNNYSTKEAMQSEWMWGEAHNDSVIAGDTLFRESTPDKEFLEEYFENRNSGVSVYVKDTKVWSCHDGKKTPFVYTFSREITGEYVKTGKDTYVLKENSERLTPYTVYVYVDPDFPFEDGYKGRAKQADTLYDIRLLFPVVGACSVLLFIGSFLFLMCSAGHKNGTEGIVPGVLSELALDFVTFVFGGVAILGVPILSIFLNGSELEAAIAFLIIGMLEVVWGTMYCMEFATRLKMGKIWRNTIIYMVLRGLWRAVKWICRSLAVLIRGIPLVIKTISIFFALTLLEMLVCLIVGWSTSLLFVWFVEKLILFPIVVYCALVCKKLQQGSEALAEGQLDYHVDTSNMFLDFREHGENLNRMGQGIAFAVEERMRSERLKTELITNVSHDLKTPLTSIINYAELLGNENLEKEKVFEYAEVLLRQSKRLKKLLEDLVEASKATTGNLEVSLAPCEISVILSQAAGEYEQRFGERGLELIIRQPEEELRILADGRHLWRTFDNLMNNIYKYAQENSRVYLNVVREGEQAEIIFRNMSKYPLDVSAEELQERFVRGDKSRHMEGNGLGLSIAKSLVELQGGSMEIVTDGDLFKVVLRFSVLEEQG